MFALKPWTEIATRVVLITVVMFNALTPTTAIAMSDPKNEQPGTSLIPPARPQGFKSAVNFVSSSRRSPTVLQVGTPVSTPIETASPTATSTPEPFIAPTVTVEATQTAIESTPTSSPTLEGTPTTSGTPVPTQTSTLSTVLSSLSLEFLANPTQAKAGDHVTFTLTITNNGVLPATGLLFSDVLPEGFNGVQSEDKSFTFDASTRTLTWKQDMLSPAPQLLPGESLALTYTVLIESQVQNTQIIDTASLSADGLKEPLNTEVTLILLGSDSARITLGPTGGDAFSADGRIKVSLPANSLTTSEAVMIENLESENPDASQGEPWIKFRLELQSSQPQETSTPVPAPGSVENDRTVPLTPIETQFNEPVELTVSFDGLIDLATLGADVTPFLVTLDEASGTWVRIPLTSIDPKANQVTAELTHFSTWGVGLGSTFPTNGAGILLYSQPYSSLFNGTTQYSIPIWTPAGRNGMQPHLALSYSSGTVDGVLGDIQAPWVGMGWNIDTVEIARKITNGACSSSCGSGSYGYKDEFVLLFNGTGYELKQDNTDPRYYHTKPESFLHIVRHNQLLGNFEPLTSNATGEWWEVVEKDGTLWRLGWTANSEQLAAMQGYPGVNWTATYPGWGSLGYAGYATNVVAARWRADQVLDTYANRMTFTYQEETRTVAGISYDQASYLSQIDYTSHLWLTIAPAYSILFVLENRGTEDVPTSHMDWDNWDTKRLDRIEVKYGLRILRTYDLGYQTRSYSDDNKTWQTTVLSSVTEWGGTFGENVAPSTIFTYIDQNNRANCGTGCQEWAYPRLASIANGWGSTATFTYANDGRPSNSWYNWRVSALDIADGISGNGVMKTTYAYSSPCYKIIAPPEDWTCNSTNLGELVGYGQTTATPKDFGGAATLAIAVHKFYTDKQKAGREYEVQNQDSASTVLSKTVTSYTTSTSPTGAYFTYVSQVQQYLDSTLVGQTTYLNDPTTGNLTWEKEFDGNLTLYRETDYEYLTNTNLPSWILNTVSKRILKDGSQAIISTQEYGYDSYLPGDTNHPPTTTKPTLSRIVSGNQTIDTAYVYDSHACGILTCSYGNLVETRLYKNYGTDGSQPTGSYISYFTNYADDPATSEDDNLQTYATSTTNPLGQITRTHYDYGTGLPTTVTDPNGNPTTTAYDGLGRVMSVTYPGYGQANVKYTYPTPYLVTGLYKVDAPFSVKMEMYDEPASTYRSAWQIMDGLGRVIQTQSPYETPGYLTITDTSFNAFGLPQNQSLPHTLNPTGGNYSAPSWGSIPYTSTSYDALQRVSAVNYPDGSVELSYYWWLRTAFVDRNGHAKVQQRDAFGRLQSVEEDTGSSSPRTLYAVTSYQYNVRDLLTNVTDANGNQTTIIYDGFGRKIEMTDPDLGNWRYRYDTLGNLSAQIDAKRQAINLYYDILNRPIGKTYNAGPVNPDTYQPPADPGYAGYTVKYYYDSGTNGVGHRTSMVDTSGTTNWTYNVLGQPTNETHNIESTNYSISTTFDAFGRPLSQTVPSQGSTENLTYTYNAMGALLSLKNGSSSYVSEIHYNASGQVKDQLLGNNLRQQSCYDSNTLRVTNLRVYSGTLQNCGTTVASPIFNFDYSYQPNGNVSQIVDSGQSETLNYSYDDLDRLLSVNGSYSETYTYEPTGNLMSKGTPTSPGTTGLAAWWSMDETAGTRTDAYGGNNLTDNNTVTSAVGLRGNAASFVPANHEFLSRADNAALSTGDIDFTLVASVYLNSTSNIMIIANKGLANSNTRDYALFYNSTNAKFSFMVGNGATSGTVSSQETVTAGRWYTIVAWHDSVNNTLNIQVNNGTVSSLSYASGGIDSTYPLSIGAHSDGYTALDGRIDEVVLYKRVLTASERIWMYNNGMGRAYADLTTSNPGTTNLISWWNLNEASGTRNDSYGTNSLTDNNTVSYAAGLQGNAASFITANSEFLSRADNAALSAGDINFTLVASVYLNSTSNIMIIANKGLQSSSIRDYLLFYNPTGSNFTFSVGNGTLNGSVASLETITAGRWYTIVAWHDAVNNTLNIQINNGTVSSISYASGAMDTTYPLSIGAHSDGSFGLNGRIDEVALYKRVLTAAERSWLYNGGVGRTYADLSAAAPGAFSIYTYGNSAHKHAVTALSTGESYNYDANGNMTTRVEGGVTYTQTFDIENRLSSVTVGTQITQFIYDGDGNLVKKIKPDGSKTLYVGGIYEVDKTSGGTVTQTRTYYPAGGAMRVDGTRYYVLKDHLGSASVVTNQSATVVGQDRFMPFGETRFTTGAMKTDKLFTGQREMAGLSIYHYGARFYSPKLGRFLSADTIVPGMGNPQSLNRFSYVLNNPLRYTDPTGHKYCDDQEGETCTRLSNSIEHTARKYRIRFKGKWDTNHQLAVIEAAELVGAKLALVAGESANKAFTAVYHGGVTMTWDLSCAGCRPASCGNHYSGECKPSGGFTAGNAITFASMTGQFSNNLDRMIKNVIHELGHVFDNARGIPSSGSGINPFMDRAVLRPNRCDQCLDWQQHPISMPNGNTKYETFGDMFIAWTYDAWNPNADPDVVNAARDWMDGLVP